MKKNMLIFGDAYGSLNYLIYFVNENIEKYDKIKIILFDSYNYEQLLKRMNYDFWNQKIIIYNIPTYNSKHINFKIWQFIKGFIEERKFLKQTFNKYFCNIKNHDIIFTVKKYKFYIFHFVSKLSLRNTIYLSDADITTNSKRTIPFSPKDIAIYARMLFIYNRSLIYKNEHNSKFIQISDKFISKYKIKMIPRENIINDIEKCFKVYTNKFNFKYKVLYFDQPIELEGELNPSKKNAFLTKVFKIINKIYPKEKIGIKFHPTLASDKKHVINFGEKIDDYLPGEFILNSNINVVISGYSNILKTNPFKTSVSLLYLLNFNKKRTEELKEYLTNGSKNPIFFPKNLIELEEIIASLS